VIAVDTVLHEPTRNATPTIQAIAQWAAQDTVCIVPTQTLTTHLATPRSRTSQWGERALQETLNRVALANPPQPAGRLFEVHAIAKQSFFVLSDCQKSLHPCVPDTSQTKELDRQRASHRALSNSSRIGVRKRGAFMYRHL
jgi:hypothetical protein